MRVLSHLTELDESLKDWERYQRYSQSGMIPEELACELSDLAGFRNVLVHIYWDLNLDEIYSILQNDLKTLRSFRDEIKELMRKDG